MSNSLEAGQGKSPEAGGRGFLIVLGVGVLGIVGLLVGNSMRGDVATPASVVEPTTDDAKSTAGTPLDSSAKVGKGASRDQVVEALGAIERHLNRAQLTFAELDSLLEQTGRPQGGVHSAPTPAAPPPEILERMQRVGNLQGAPPPGGRPAPETQAGGTMTFEAGRVDLVPAGRAGNFLSEEQNRADELWSGWLEEWPRDLEAASALLPAEPVPDPQLESLRNETLALLEACQQVPEGRPPAKSARATWLEGHQAAVAKLRAALDAMR